MKQKPVILLNIDSLMPEPLEIAIQTGHAPALEFLMDNGTYFPNMVSSFPTMSVTIDSSFLTGTYTDKHKIPALNWFDVNSNEFVNYGTGPTETFRIGVRKTVHNMLYNLNNEHLSRDVKTIYEELAEHGLSSASINSFVYRGNTPTKLRVPKLFKAMTYFEDGKWVSDTPPILSLGAFSKIKRSNISLKIAAGNYRYMGRELRQLIKKRKLPSFTFCIFQDLDLRMHFKGPMDIKGIAKIDREIQKTLNLFPSWEDAIKENTWLVIGDNGHAAMHHKRKKALIDLRKLLKNYRIAKLQRKVQKKDQLVFSVNQRMAYIYILDGALPFSSIISKLKLDPRIDIIAWKEDDSIHVESGLKDGSFRFSPGGNFYDMFSQHWNLDGNPELLNLKIENKKITFNDYPDVLARLYGALHSHAGRIIVVNAKPGHEFKAQLTPHHPGAAHGSLHKQESLLPLIITGTSEKPIHPRIVDLKEFILRIILRP